MTNESDIPETLPAGSTCVGNRHNCAMLARLNEDHAERRKEGGITDDDSIVRAMAVGLVIEVWRNGPVEDMHAGRRGPSDAVMFAESTALHEEAVKALTVENRHFGLIDFEKHLLDRARPWAGAAGRTLQDLGYGFLGHYARHVKDRTNALMGLGDHTCSDDPLQPYLVRKALTYGAAHKGMPTWPLIVERIGLLLSEPDHPAWRNDGWGKQAVAEMPSQVQSTQWLTDALLASPSALPVEVLEWLSDHFLYCAAPPYSGFR